MYYITHPLGEQYVYITSEGLFCFYSHRMTGTIDKMIFRMMCPASSMFSVPEYFPTRRYMTPVDKDGSTFFISDAWFILEE